MGSFVSEWRTVVSSKVVSSGNGVFNPLTPAMNSTSARYARFAVELQGVVSCEVLVGAQYSNDGVTWSGADALGWDAGNKTWVAAEIWTYGDTFVHLTTPDVGEKLFVRFGVFARSTSTAIVRNAQVRLKVDLRPVAGARTLAVGPMVVASGTSTATVRFYAMTEAMPTDGIVSMRGTWEMQAETGATKIRGAYQTSEDGVTGWSASTPIRASWQSADGFNYGTTFVNTDLNSKGFIRFGMDVSSDANERDMCQASLRVDLRGE